MQRFALMAATLLLAGPALAQPSSVPVDGLTEMQREMTRRGEPAVPLQNRESRQADALGPMQGSGEWLKQAQDALRSGQLGQANEYLERAATRLLTRSTVPSQAEEPMQDRRLTLISEARKSLSRRDRREAERQIGQALMAH